MEKTFVMIKPDGVKKGLIGEIIKRFEKRGLTLEALKMQKLTQEEARKLYFIHQNQSFFEDLVNFVISGPVVLMVLAGPKAVKVVREMMGSTNPQEASPGTIRGDFALDIEANILHGADSLQNAHREISLFFPEQMAKL